MRKRKYIFAIAALALTACTEHDFFQTEGSDKELSFVVTESSAWDATRADNGPSTWRVQETLSDYSQPLYLHTYTATEFPSDFKEDKNTRSTLTKTSTLTEFGVSGYHYNKMGGVLANTPPNFLYNVLVTKANDWKAKEPYYYPSESNEYMAFYAYSPYHTNSNVTVVSTATTVGAPQIQFVVDDAVANQIDFLTAESNKTLAFNNSDVKPVELTFKHALTAININISENVMDGVIDSVRFQNIYKTGINTIGTGWTSKGSIGDITIDLSAGGGFDTTADDKALTSEAKSTTLLMIPQTFTNDNQEIIVYLREGATKYTVYATLNGTSWTEGTTVTYEVSTTKLNFATVDVTYPELWGTETFELKDSYLNNESVGIFAVSKSGKVVIENYKYNCLGTSWTYDDPNERIYANDTLTYFAYYPYKTGLTVGTTANPNATAETFFSSIMTGWTVTADQSDSTKLVACDLHIAKGNINKKAISFDMSHAFGLAVLTLESKSIPTTKYWIKDDPKNYWFYGGITTVMASDLFTGSNLPCPIDRRTNSYCKSPDNYYYVVKGGSATLSNSRSGTDDEWYSTKNITFTPANNASQALTADIKHTLSVFTKEYLNEDHNYVLAQGDVYYNDGALSHYGDGFWEFKTPIGIVYSLSPTSYDSNTRGYTHGYVVAAKNARPYAYSIWSSSSATSLTSGISYVAYNKISSDREGLYKTTLISNRSDFSESTFTAVYRAINNEAECPTDKCSGWFLPATGQVYDWIAASGYNLGSPSTSAAAGIIYSGKASACATAMNSYFTNRGFVAGETYDGLYYNSNGYTIVTWTVTELNTTHAWNMHFTPYSNNKGAVYFYSGHLHSQNFGIRPFLAF